MFFKNLGKIKEEEKMLKNENCFCLAETTINDMWRRLMWHTLEKGYGYVIGKGSYEGQIRVQLPFVSFQIKEPARRPLAVIMPEGSGISPPTTETRIEEYFYDYLMTGKIHELEEYTYGQYINEEYKGKTQLERIIELLNVSEGRTNQATLSIGDPKIAHSDDPPCLRVVDFKVLPGDPPELQMSIFFRSWDLFVGLPENLGGLQLLKEYVAMHLNFEVKDGSIICSSPGLHIYEQYFRLIETLTRKKIIILEKSSEKCKIQIIDQINSQ